MIEIDGSQGEGGGQILRTALALSALTGQAFRLYNVRAGRQKPGLAPQHLAAIRAVADVCSAEVRGGALRSQDVTFAPRAAPQAGEYAVDVTQAAGGGSAGAATLILQALLLPLALAPGRSRVVLRGGTHVTASPSYHYLAHVYLPTLERMGIAAEALLRDFGFYPAGGGEIVARIPGGQTLQPLALIERGQPRRAWGVAVAANLPAHIPQRIASRARNVLARAGVEASVTALRERSAGPGAGLFLVAEYERSVAGFASLGKLGKSSEQVAEEAALDLLRHYGSGQPVDMHLADQLLLPMALAAGRSELRTCRLTTHAFTHAAVIRRFLPVQILFEGEEDRPGRIAVEGAGLAGA